MIDVQERPLRPFKEQPLAGLDGVDGGESPSRLAGDVQAERLRHPADLREERPERLPLDELHDHVVRRDAAQLRGARLERAHHVRVVDRGARARLAPEAPGAPAWKGNSAIG